MSDALSWVNERIEDHVNAMLDLWDAKYCRFYRAPLQRVLSVPEPGKIVEAAVILHDVGKLVHWYQRYLRRKEKGERATLGYYRHEFVSAAVSFLALENLPWRHLAAAAILLHHEPILMGQVHILGEEYVTLTKIYSTLADASKSSDLRPSDRVCLTGCGVDALNGILDSRGFGKLLRESYNLEDLKEALKKLVVRISLRSDKHVIRVRVAALTHVLVLLDSLAARSRSDDEGGNFISIQAPRAEVAEICVS